MNFMWLLFFDIVRCNQSDGSFDAAGLSILSRRPLVLSYNRSFFAGSSIMVGQPLHHYRKNTNSVQYEGSIEDGSPWSIRISRRISEGELDHRVGIKNSKVSIIFVMQKFASQLT